MAVDQVFTIKQGDTLPKLVEQLFNADGTTIDLSTATAIELHVRFDDRTTMVHGLGDGVSVQGNPLDGIVEYAWQDGDTLNVGHHLREWYVRFASGADITVPNSRPGYTTRVEAALVVTP